MENNFLSYIWGEMWDWQGTSNCLEDNLDISKCLWRGVSQEVEDVSYMLNDEITPVKDCSDLSYCINNCGEMSKGSEKCDEPSSQSKRRRMLQFNAEGLDIPIGNEDPSCTYPRSKERENSIDEALSEISQWVSGYAEGTSASGYESLDQSSEGWLASCFTDDVQISPNDMVNEVQIDIAGLCNNPPEFANVIPDAPVGTRRKVFKGRKSYMQTSANSASSVAYPFSFIKPCAFHGDVTLKDINQRICTPPSNLKQSNDDPAPYPTSAFSGKPVVGTTKIHTEGGKGSITIMRTKG